MIALNLPAVVSDPRAPPFVTRLARGGANSATLVAEFGGREVYQAGGLTIDVAVPPGVSLLGDVVFVEPAIGRLSRWIRAGSPHNTLLVTERCDQLCIMCSQPPKKHHADLFAHFLEACLLADPGSVIGLSGGEPLLYKAALFSLIERVHETRPDLRFHVLTNAQHFEPCDLGSLSRPALKRVQWGIPLYAADPDLHDRVVGKQGAFARLQESFALLAQAGQIIELRTVLLRQNYNQLETQARWVSARLPFISVWALMQLERAGFARNRWNEQFIDHSANPRPLVAAIALARSRGLAVALYNTPHCTVATELRPYLQNSISDWKRAFPKACDRCTLKGDCCGFFAWHAELSDYVQGGAL